MIVTRKVEPEAANFRYIISVQTSEERLLRLYDWVKERLGPYEETGPYKKDYRKIDGWSFVIYCFRNELDAFLFYSFAEGLRT